MQQRAAVLGSERPHPRTDAILLRYLGIEVPVSVGSAGSQGSAACSLRQRGNGRGRDGSAVTIDSNRSLVCYRRRYGYRRITAELHPSRRAVELPAKKVARLMRDDNLLAIQSKTIRRHDEFENIGSRCNRNLASRMRLTGINQLWVADITYVSFERRVCLPSGNPRWRFLARL